MFCVCPWLLLFLLQKTGIVTDENDLLNPNDEVSKLAPGYLQFSEVISRILNKILISNVLNDLRGVNPDHSKGIYRRQSDLSYV